MIPYNKNLTNLARQLRKNPTEPERLLWSRLRLNQLEDCRFYRQKPLVDYIVDFYCPKMKLVIEIDGDDHYFDQKYKKDRIRDAALVSLGLKVFRFTNHDVMTNIDGVLETIYTEISQVP